MHINFATKRSFSLSLDSLKNFKFDVAAFREIKFTKMLMVIIAGALLFMMILYGGIQKARLGSLTDEKAKMERMVADLRAKSSAKGEAIIDVGGRTNVISAYENRVEWAGLIEKIAATIPYRIWLESITGDSQTKKVHLSGEGPDQAAVAGLVGALQNSGIFANVDILSSAAVASKDEAGKGMDYKIRFETDCVVK